MDVEKNFQNNTEVQNDRNTVFMAVTPEMRGFAEEYALWLITAGQIYINALSDKFTTESTMDIFIDKYYSKNWLKGRFK